MLRATSSAAVTPFLKRYWPRIGVGLLFACALLPLAHLGPMALPDVLAILILLATQIFWIRRVGAFGGKLVPGRSWRIGLGTAGLVIYFLLLAYNLQNWTNAS